ncbi:MAG: aminopeptidase P family protein, partial [Alphaproteobacteria bacterium]
MRSFSNVTRRKHTWAAGRLAGLREELARQGLDGFIVPHADEHQSEYLPPRAERLAWLTGFTGSAGIAVVLPERAAIFVDGRYTLQVRRQVDQNLYEPLDLVGRSVSKWVRGQLAKGQRLGYDPWLLTQAQVETFREACAEADARLEACAENPIDAIWPDQPPPPVSPVATHDIQFAGRSSADKRADVGAELVAGGAAAAVLTQPDSIAWLLNVRGSDIPHNPLPLSFGIVHADGSVELFIDSRKLPQEVVAHLGNQVSVSDPSAFAPALDRLAGAEGRVRVCPRTAAAWIFDRLTAAGARIQRGDDPCSLPKACKNEIELEGARAAHRRDGAALTRFLHWISETAPRQEVTEISAAATLADFRKDGEHYRGTSFETISGAGPNGAIVHYRVTEATNRRVEPGSLYLVDSGAQYLDGTTDVTRTVAIGEPTDEMRDHFTRVLKGHIAIATATFPAGTTGAQLDTLARQYLWQAGLDYGHGTGHGVGSYLCVHEGPQRIAKAGSSAPLKPGMIVSNEPGYYKEGAYGIRIENLVTVVRMDDVDGAETELLGLETLTLAPIDINLVVPSMLDQAEIDWLDRYHRRVREVIGPLLEGAARAWLEEATESVER